MMPVGLTESAAVTGYVPILRKKQMEQMAKAQRVSISRLVEDAIVEFLERHFKERPTQPSRLSHKSH